ncbi:hypothetical protein B296_00018018 [Ensete ventricosum]|uniref:Uncharacterized protein n=1 Tax=Ensete ventricosum TaxID=4639 RepID=A0A427A8K0_ENSVE|nr:hypothetical protein B296_00018018 [Ensete ventricosum]
MVESDATSLRAPSRHVTSSPFSLFPPPLFFASFNTLSRGSVRFAFYPIRRPFSRIQFVFLGFAVDLDRSRLGSIRWGNGRRRTCLSRRCSRRPRRSMPWHPNGDIVCEGSFRCVRRWLMKLWSSPLTVIRLVNLCTFYLNEFRIILQVPFYIGELTEKVVEDDRLMVLKLSQDYLKEFIAICEALELIPEEELESSSHRGAKTPANQRAKKIARFKRQRAAEAKLQEINEKKERRRRSLRAAALSSPVEVGEEDILDDDGEEEREV